MKKLTEKIHSAAAGFFSSKLSASALLVFIVFITFFPVLEADYLAYDEPAEILAGYLINQPLDLNVLWQIFSTIEKGANQYTPLSIASFWLEFNIFGQNSAVSHLINLFLHCLAGIAVYLFLLRIIKRPSVAWFAAVLWAVHPLQVQSVAWVLERRNLLYGLFLSGSFYLYAVSVKSCRKWPAGLALIFMMLSGLAKTLAFFAPAVWLMIDLLLGRRDYLKMLREKIPAFILGLILMLVMLNSASGGISKPAGGLFDVNLATFSMSFYVYKTIWPFEILPVYEANPSLENLLKTGPVLFALTIILLVLISRKGNLAAAGCLFYLLHIFPLSGLVRVGKRFYAAGHFMYIPLLGLIVAFTAMAEKIYEKKSRHLFGAILPSMIILVSATISHFHCYIWQNSAVLYEYVLASDPESEFARRNLAVFYSETASFSKAAQHFYELVKRHPEKKEYLQGYAASLFSAGDWSESLRNYEIYIQKFPECFQGFKGKAEILMSNNKPIEAEKNYSIAIASGNAPPAVYFGRAAARLSSDNFDGALKDLNYYLDFKENDLKALMMKTEAARGQGIYFEAIESAQKIVELRPDSIVFRQRLFELLCESLDYERASVEFARICSALIYSSSSFSDNIEKLFRGKPLHTLMRVFPWRGLLTHWFGSNSAEKLSDKPEL